jgi:hypothetical protein
MAITAILTAKFGSVDLHAPQDQQD